MNMRDKNIQKRKKETIKEKEFYNLFANYLEHELDEFTKQ